MVLMHDGVTLYVSCLLPPTTSHPVPTMEISAVKIAIELKKFIKGKRDAIEDLSLANGFTTVVQESKERKSRVSEKKRKKPSYNTLLSRPSPCD